jgi:FtsH-binding integral membrane protein
MKKSMSNPYQSPAYTPYGSSPFVIDSSADERSAFIQRTYLHLAGAIFLFVALEAIYFTLIPAETLAQIVGGMTGGYGWLIVLGLFMGASWLANYWANSSQSQPMQYAGLGLYVAAESLIFLPLLSLAIFINGLDKPSYDIPLAAGGITLLIFGGLTITVFVTKTDFSGMGPYLGMAGFAALAAVFCAVIFRFDLGVWFAYAMVVLASGYILYYTSNVMRHYTPTQHVAAALALFAAVALLFYYILVIFLRSRR